MHIFFLVRFSIFTSLSLLIVNAYIHSQDIQNKDDRDALVQIAKDMDFDNRLNWYSPKTNTGLEDGAKWDGVRWSFDSTNEFNARVKSIFIDPFSNGFRLSGTSDGFMQLDALTELWLPGSKLNDIYFLRNCKNLKKLVIDNTGITNISTLEYMPYLETLDISYNPLKDFITLTHLNNIRYLNISKTNINTLKHLKDMLFIEVLIASSNFIKSISSIQNCTKLISLRVDENNISDISPLKSMKDLKYLHVNNNNVYNISSLISNTNLTELSLINNRIVNIDILGEMHSLGFIYLNDNRICDIKSLVNLASLRERKLANLQELSLDGNRLSLNTLFPLMRYNIDISIGKQIDVPFLALNSHLIVGENIDLSDEYYFEDNYTEYIVIRNDNMNCRINDDYLMNNGFFIFLKPGTYKIIMRNKSFYSKGMLAEIHSKWFSIHEN